MKVVYVCNEKIFRNTQRDKYFEEPLSQMAKNNPNPTLFAVLAPHCAAIHTTFSSKNFYNICSNDESIFIFLEIYIKVARAGEVKIWTKLSFIRFPDFN